MAAFSAFVSQIDALIQIEQVVGLVHVGLVAYSLAVIVDKKVAHDGVHPSFEIGFCCIFFFVVQCFQGSFLKKVVGIFVVGC